MKTKLLVTLVWIIAIALGAFGGNKFREYIDNKKPSDESGDEIASQEKLFNAYEVQQLIDISVDDLTFELRSNNIILDARNYELEQAINKMSEMCSDKTMALDSCVKDLMECKGVYK